MAWRPPKAPCRGCGGPADCRNLSGLCRSCHFAWRARNMHRTCTLCGRPRLRRSASALCRACDDLRRADAPGPLPSDPPRVHLYHARAMARLPLFAEGA